MKKKSRMVIQGNQRGKRERRKRKLGLTERGWISIANERIWKRCIISNEVTKEEFITGNATPLSKCRKIQQRVCCDGQRPFDIEYLVFKLRRLIVSMNRLIVKVDADKRTIENHGAKYVHSQDKVALNGSVSQKMLDVRQRIDHHLGKTYQKLRLNLIKPWQLDAPFRQLDTNTKQKSPANKDAIKVIQMKRRNNYSTVEQYHSPILKTKQHYLDDHSLGISNKEVMEYIHLIYQTYNIKDPLAHHSNEEETEATVAKNKNVECESIDSARTTKVNAVDIVQVSEFDIGKGETNKKLNKIVITLRSKIASKHKRNATNPLYSEMESTMKFGGKTKEKLAFRQDNNSNIPTFRYCFACEQAIMETNIEAHQQSCQMLRQAFTFSFPKIIGILNEKIERLKTAISKQLLEVSTQKLSHHFSDLQQTIGTWLQSIDSPSSQINPTWRKQYKNVKAQLATTFLDPFQLLNKLNWFTRLRSNILALPTKPHPL